MDEIFHPSLDSRYYTVTLTPTLTPTVSPPLQTEDPNLAAIAALSPTFMYVPTLDHVTLNGSNVSVLANYVAPDTAAQELVQGTPGFQPEWLENSGLPSGVPAVRGDGVDDRLSGFATGLPATFASDCTLFLLGRRRTGSVNQCGGSILNTGQGLGVLASNTLGIRRLSYGNQGITRTVAAGESFWIRVDLNGVGNPTTYADDLGNTVARANLTAPANTATSLQMCALTSLGNYTDSEIAMFVGFSSVLSAPNAAAVGAALSAYGGL